MSLTGQLSDLSLAELIEFFCNQRKTGRLKVSYIRCPGYFYFLRGELIDAKIGSLIGVEAVHYALTQENASFKFNAAIEPSKRTIHQPWASVALEGLRRMDEGIVPGEPVVDPLTRNIDPDVTDENRELVNQDEAVEVPFSLTMDRVNNDSGRNKVMFAGVAAAVVLSVAAIGVPAGWYKHKASVVAPPVAGSQLSNKPSVPTASSSEQPGGDISSSSETTPATGASSNDAALAARREKEARDRERQRADKAQPSAASQPTAVKPDAPKAAPKMVSVQVTYDENGRVTQTSGGDGMAQRIARQKRFPTGKAGSATVSIPV
ncbi:MAG: hypothetical protein QOH96_3960, partial [Blastocatellia bacterium]|nr:hypothetical protein [Blastocatellia bacterium]